MLDPRHASRLPLALLSILMLQASCRGVAKKKGQSHAAGLPALQSEGAGVLSQDAEADSAAKSEPSDPSSPSPLREKGDACQELTHFETVVYPLLKTEGCVRCHNAEQPYNANKFFLGGASLAMDEICSQALVRTNFGKPTDSLLLLKPSQNGVRHVGGTLLGVGESVYEEILLWINKERGIDVTTAQSSRRIRLLSNREYLRTVSALFNRPLALALDNDLGELFDNQLTSMTLSRAEKYFAAAFRLQEELPLASIPFAACSAKSPEACVGDFIEQFGLRAWRRPLSAIEINDLKAFWTATYTDVKEGYEPSIRRLLTVFLSSPKFFYRTEMGQPESDGRYKLSPYEVASALSYSIWGLPPDAELLQAAASGALATPEQIHPVALRMMQAPGKGRYVFEAFATLLFQLVRLDSVTKSESLGPLTSELKQALKQELTFFLSYAVANESEPFKALWTKSYSLNDPIVAAYYGVPAAPAGLELLRLPADTRSGVLSRGAFLMVNSNFADTNPMRRGAKVIEHFLCRKLGAPPAEAQQAVMMGLNSREFRAANPSCRNCHGEIDPIGYAFEAYNPLGKHRVSGIDLSGQVHLDGQDLEFSGVSGPGGLGALLADSEEAEKCFVERWYEFMVGYPGVDAVSRQALERIYSQYTTAKDLKELLASILSDESFLYRSP